MTGAQKCRVAHAMVSAAAGVLITAMVLLSTAAPLSARSRRHPGPPQVHLFKTHGSLAEQNAEADLQHLPRIQNDAEMRELIGDGELTAVPGNLSALRAGVPRERAYLRPWATDFLLSFAGEYYSTFGQPLTLDSAVRTVKFQKRLRRWNRNAAPATGEAATVHTTGIAFDIQRRKMNPAQLRWTEWRLFYLQATGKVIVEEEVSRRNSCFHVVVRRESLSPATHGDGLRQLESGLAEPTPDALGGEAGAVKVEMDFGGQLDVGEHDAGAVTAPDDGNAVRSLQLGGVPFAGVYRSRAASCFSLAVNHSIIAPYASRLATFTFRSYAFRFRVEWLSDPAFFQVVTMVPVSSPMTTHTATFGRP